MELFNLTDEEIWLKYMLSRNHNRAFPSEENVKEDCKMADRFLQEFKKRFRKSS